MQSLMVQNRSRIHAPEPHSDPTLVQTKERVDHRSHLPISFASIPLTLTFSSASYSSSPSMRMADDLLAAVSPLAYPARMTALWKFGQNTPSEQVAKVIANLEARGGDYEARIAATLAHASRNTRWAAAHLADTNPSVRRKALKLSRQLPDSAIIIALDDAPAAVRFDIYRALKGRAALADDLINRVRAEWGDKEASRLLPWCSPPVVQRLLPALLLALVDTRCWRSMAQLHPEMVYAALAANLDQSVKDGIESADWWYKYGTAVRALVKHASMAGKALDLYEAHYHTHVYTVFADCLATYARLEPQRLLRLFVTSDGRERIPLSLVPTKRLLRKLVRSRFPEVEAWAKEVATTDGGYELPQFLEALPPSQRVKTYELSYPPSDPIVVFGNSDLRHALPTDYLTQLARRALADPKDLEWVKRLSVLAYFPPGEVKAEFIQGTRRPEPADRGTAWKWYIVNAKVHGAQTLADATAEAARRLRNEQQPVRAKAIKALANVPARLWNTDALGYLTTIMTDAIEARDQAGEWGVLNTMAGDILVAHGDSAAHVQWVHESFQTLTSHARTLYMPDLVLRKGQETIIWNAYKPFIQVDASKNEYSTLLALADALGERAANIPELQEALWGAITSDHLYSVPRAASLWLEPKAHRARRVAELIEYDDSAVALQAVAEIVATRRTDLLHHALGGEAPSGRFCKAGSTWVFAAPRLSPTRWTPSQTAAYLLQMKVCVADAGVATWTKMAGLKPLKGLPGGLDLARSLASNADNDVPLIESGLGALVISPADLPFLYSFAGGDRARVAIHTASGAARRERPSVLEPLLVQLLADKEIKITSRKEAIRQATSLLPLSVSGPLLLRLSTMADLHRDVRMTCVAASTGLLSLASEAGWGVIEGAASAKQPEVRQAVCRASPLDLRHEHRQRHAVLVVRLADDADIEVKITALQSLASWAPFSTNAGACLLSALTDMASPDRVWRTAGRSLITWGDEKSLISAAESLLDHGEETAPNDEEDMPAVQRLEVITSGVQSKVSNHKYHRIARALSALLVPHVDRAPTAAALLVATLDRRTPEALLAGLKDVARLLDGRPVLAANLRAEVSGSSKLPEGMDAVVRALIDAGGITDAIIAVGLVTRLGQDTKWAKEWRERLRQLRGHAEPDVRYLARQTRMTISHRGAGGWGGEHGVGC